MANKFEKLFKEYLEQKAAREELTKRIIEEVNNQLEGKADSVFTGKLLGNLKPSDERHPAQTLLN
jgi:hypothetical protein